MINKKNPNRKKNNPRLDPLIEGYLSYLADVERKAPRTVTDIRCTLKRIGKTVEGIVPQTHLWKMSFQNILTWVRKERQADGSEQSIAKMISHLRGFLNYAWRSGRTGCNVLDGFHLREPRPEAPRALSVPEALELVRQCPNANPIQRRDRMIVLLLYGCGLRTAELADLRIQDVHQDRKELFVRSGKGDRQRTIPIPEAVFTELLAYLLERGAHRGPLLRTQIKKRRISSREICKVVRQAVIRTKIVWKVTPKTLRHSYATHLMDQGVDLAVIASLMGHRSPSETGVYLHVLEGRPRSAVDQLPQDTGKESG